MTILLDYNLNELQEIIEAHGEPVFRATQLYQAMLSGKNFEDKMNLPKSMLDKFKNAGMVMQPVTIYKEKKSKDKTVKFLYKLADNEIVEGVLMKYKFGNTICVSTQIGCKMNCKFCASSLNGFVRNLSVGEMLGQVVAVNKYLGGSFKDRKITNIVLMGSGEPLDNFSNVVKFLQVLTDENGFNFSVRNISVSTCGLPNKIEELADTGMAVTLSISLHAPNDTIRKEIMPIAKKYAIPTVLESAKYYNTISNRRVIFEYTLIDEVNNKPTHARQLAELVKDIPCHINLIKLNEVDGRNLKSPTVDSCEDFLNMLNRLGVSATLRRTMGDDVEGACGQLRNRELREARENQISGYKTHQPRKKDTKKVKVEKTTENKKISRVASSKTLNIKEKYKKEEKKNPRQKARFNEKTNSNRVGRHR